MIKNYLPVKANIEKFNSLTLEWTYFDAYS